MNKSKLIERIEASPARSAWARGVKAYALEMVNQNQEKLKRDLLNGAESWAQYSEGGCSLVYNSDIAERLCAPWELKRTDGGRLPPNGRENWIDCQTRALGQAWGLIQRAVKGGAL